MAGTSRERNYGGFLVTGLRKVIRDTSLNICTPIEPSLWLFSRRADFWLACGGASIGLLAAIVLIFWRGDRELDAVDFVLSEFHLGATYDAILRRRLWHHRRFDVLLVPLVILALTYAFFVGRTNDLTHVDRYVCRRLAPRPAESGRGAFLPAWDRWAGIADA